MNNYYDHWELTQIRKLVKTNPYLAKIKYEEYLQKFPEDCHAYVSYANCLNILGLAEESDRYVSVCLQIIESSNKYLNSPEKVKYLKNECYYTYLKNLAYRGQYQTLYKSLITNSSRLIELSRLSNLKRKRCIDDAFCYSKLLSGNSENTIDNRASYKASQIIDYQEERFYEHIQKHLKSFLPEYEIFESAVFNEDFPIKEIVEEAKKQLLCADRLFSFFVDEYYFEYNGCGEVDGKKTDYFKIVVLHNTDKLITMYPTAEGKNLHSIDLNYLQQGKGNSRKLSQIDKFNMRYKK